MAKQYYYKINFLTRLINLSLKYSLKTTVKHILHLYLLDYININYSAVLLIFV